MLALALLLAAAPATGPAPPAPATMASGLRIQILKPGAGSRPGPADAVLVTYEGRLADGTLFDKSDEPVGMTVAGVVPGFAEALQLMNAGGTYRIWIPPELGYGESGGGPIPPGATLEFTVTLLRVGRPAPPSQAR